MVYYPSVDELIEFNLLALNVIKATKSDAPKILSKSKIFDVLTACEQNSGDVYGKGVVLLKDLIQAHAFASGNRRTSFLALKYFLIINHHQVGVPDNPENVRIFLGIRENYYSDAELKERIKHGKIREFKR